MKVLVFPIVALVAATHASAIGAAQESPVKKPACCSHCAMTEQPSASEAAMTARSLYQVDGAWTNDAGREVSLASLRGRPVVLAMFFTHCEYACPVLVSDMQRLRETLPAETRARAQFVLVSFDSARDTPDVLKAYRARDALDGNWTLLHGDPAQVQELAMLLGVKYKEDARGQYSHSNLITVLNGQGEIAYQRAGLMGDVSEAAKAVVFAAK